MLFNSNLSMRTKTHRKVRSRQIKVATYRACVTSFLLVRKMLYVFLKWHEIIHLECKLTVFAGLLCPTFMERTICK